MAQDIIGLGAGGHAKVLIETLRQVGDYEIVGLLDPDPAKWNTQLLGVVVLGSDDLLPGLLAQGIHYVFIGLGGTGNTHPRRLLYEKALKLGFFIPVIIHPLAIVSPSARVGVGANIMPGAIVNADAQLGQNVIINSGAIVEHDCVIEDHVHIASGARLASTVYVGEGAHIGAGATVKQCIQIGAWAVVGAGAVVIRDVAPHQTVVGVPARPLNK